MNNFIRFYTENNISPVTQDINDMKSHYNRRTGLYRTLGLSPLLFKNRDILEVAPGSGHNSIVTASYGLNSYDLVEPNPVGYNNMINLFDKYQLTNNSVQFFNVLLEDFPKDKQYDIVLCEGLIPGLNNSDLFLQQLSNKVLQGGVLVVTCADAVSAFFETLRRYLSRILVHDLKQCTGVSSVDAVDAVDLLFDAFQSHLKSLKGMSRPVEDWIWDNLLNPASASLAATNEFSIQKSFDYFGEKFYFYGSNPICMDDYTWYKNISDETESFNKAFLNSFLSKQINFLHYKETTRPDQDLSTEIYKYCKEFSMQVEQRNPLNPGPFSVEIINEDLKPVYEIKKLLEKTDLQLSFAAIYEFLELFNDMKLPTVRSISEMHNFLNAFGRGQQYISFVKK